MLRTSVPRARARVAARFPDRSAIADSVTTWLYARDAATADGFDLPADPPGPGDIVRFRLRHKGASNRSAQAWLAPDCTAVVVTDWTAGPARYAYRPSVQRGTDSQERAWIDAQRAKYRAQAKAKEAERRRLGTLTARTAWLAATPCADHPYMRSKGEKLPGCRVDVTGTLLVSRIDVDGNLIGLQRIDATGGKRYWPGAPTAGTFYRLGKLDDADTIVVCEGAATGATLHRETRHTVACAMDAGNLMAVCRALRAQYPRAGIVVAGDDDRGTPGNPGRSTALQAAEAVDGLVWLPEFCAACDGRCSDHNDVAVCRRRA